MDGGDPDVAESPLRYLPIADPAAEQFREHVVPAAKARRLPG